MIRKSVFLYLCLVLVAVLSPASPAQESGSLGAGLHRLITFNGTLKNANGEPVFGIFGMTFSLYAAQEGGDPLWRESQTVQTDDQGRYIVLLGATEREGLPLEVFTDRKAQWLGVQVDGDAEQPRILLLAVPYALKAADADTVGGKPLSSFVLYEDLERAEEKSRSAAVIIAQASAAGPGSIGVRQAAGSTAGGKSTAKQAMSESPGRVLYSETTTNTWFGGAAGASLLIGAVGNSFFGYNVGHSTNTGNYNSFLGAYAGYLNTTGTNNTFVGSSAGHDNTTGTGNTFVGTSSGLNNVSGENSFFGAESGLINTSGSSNSFFGYQSGYSNTGGDYNTFVGSVAGSDNTTGNGNSGFGRRAGQNNNTGGYNTFLGYYSGQSHTSGSYNLFTGYSAGNSNTTENNNSFMGALSNGAVGITNATAVGYRATVGSSNSLVLGSINGINGSTADTTIGIGTTTPSLNTRLDVRGSFASPIGARTTASYSYFTPASNHDGYVFGLESGASYTGAVNLTRGFKDWPAYAIAALQGYYGGTVATGSGGAGSVASVTGVVAQNLMRNGIAVTDAIGLQVMPASADVGSATVSNVTGVYVKNPYNVTPANVYGLYTDNLTAGVNNYGVYVNGNSKSYFGGNVGIGTTAPTQKLHVVGNMRVSGSILYGAPDEPVPDYVFERDYNLMPVEELARFVEKEKHLPNIPGAAEIKENGLNLGEFQMKLLEKIEELTLYTLNQARAIKGKDAEISSLNDRLSGLERMVQRLAAEK